jgi:ankyrin repeat protein
VAILEQQRGLAVQVGEPRRPARLIANLAGSLSSVTLPGVVERGADPELANDRGQVPLAGAAFKGDITIARLLLDGGASVDGAGLIGRAPLLFATMFGRGEVVSLLRARGTSADRCDAVGPAPGAPLSASPADAIMIR